MELSKINIDCLEMSEYLFSESRKLVEKTFASKNLQNMEVGLWGLIFLGTGHFLKPGLGPKIKWLVKEIFKWTKAG